MDKRARLLESIYIMLYILLYMGAGMATMSLPVMVREAIHNTGIIMTPAEACASYGTIFGVWMVVACWYLIKAMDCVLYPAVKKYWSLEKRDEAKRTFRKWMVILYLITLVVAVLINV